MRIRVLTCLLVAVLACGAVAVHAQSASASFQIPRQSIDAGAGRASSATYTVHGTLGQPDATGVATSATYALRGGFHVEVAAPLADPIFSNGFEP